MNEHNYASLEGRNSQPNTVLEFTDLFHKCREIRLGTVSIERFPFISKIFKFNCSKISETLMMADWIDWLVADNQVISFQLYSQLVVIMNGLPANPIDAFIYSLCPLPVEMILKGLRNDFSSPIGCSDCDRIKELVNMLRAASSSKMTPNKYLSLGKLRKNRTQKCGFLICVHDVSVFFDLQLPGFEEYFKFHHN